METGWLVVSPVGSKVWGLLRKSEGIRKQFTIGRYPSVSLKQAREARDRVNAQPAQGIDPCEKHDEETPTGKSTFRDVSLEWFEKKTCTQAASSRLLKGQRIISPCPDSGTDPRPASGSWISY